MYPFSLGVSDQIHQFPRLLIGDFLCVLALQENKWKVAFPCVALRSSPQTVQPTQREQVDVALNSDSSDCNCPTILGLGLFL